MLPNELEQLGPHHVLTVLLSSHQLHKELEDSMPSLPLLAWLQHVLQLLPQQFHPMLLQPLLFHLPSQLLDCLEPD